MRAGLGCGFLGALAFAVIVLGCSGSSSPSGFDDGSGNGNGNGGSSGGGAFGGGGKGSSGSNPAGADPNTPPCDDGVTGATGEDFAKAIGLCTSAAKDGYGLVSATFTRGYGRSDAPKAEQHGVLAKFGDVIKPREGKMLAALSTGYAQEYDGTGSAPFGGDGLAGTNGIDWWNAQKNRGNGTAPPGFPKPASGCPIDTHVNDVVDLKLTIQAPTGATGFKFDFDFYSGEWPAYVCSSFNDGFVAYLSAKGFNGGKPDNVSFDKNNNPVSVNNGFFDRCTPNVTTGCESLGGAQATSMCPGGPAELGGTGFGVSGKWCLGSNQTSTNGGATGWLTTQAPISGGETFTLEFMIWDTGDGVLDSSVLIDNFKWIGGAPVSAGTERPN
jgi:hypothetical protein